MTTEVDGTEAKSQSRRALGWAIIAIAVVTDLLFLLNPNLMFLSATYWWDDKNAAQVWIPVFMINLIFLVAALATFGALTWRRAGLCLLGVAILCVPLAVVLQARLPHDTIPDYRRALDTIERTVPNIKRSYEESQDHCEFSWNLGGEEPTHTAFVSRYYYVQGRTVQASQAAVAAVKRHFLRLGYERDREWESSGEIQLRGPDTSVDIVNYAGNEDWATTADFVVSLERHSCSPLERVRASDSRVRHSAIQSPPTTNPADAPPPTLSTDVADRLVNEMDAWVLPGTIAAATARPDHTLGDAAWRWYQPTAGVSPKQAALDLVASLRSQGYDDLTSAFASEYGPFALWRGTCHAASPCEMRIEVNDLKGPIIVTLQA